jgi:hypothetical protein
MAGRKILDEADARACLAQAESEGLTRGQYAQEHGIDGRSLSAWYLNLTHRERHSAWLRRWPESTPLCWIELPPPAKNGCSGVCPGTSPRRPPLHGLTPQGTPRTFGLSSSSPGLWTLWKGRSAFHKSTRPVFRVPPGVGSGQRKGGDFIQP